METHAQLRVLHVAESVQGGCGTYLNEIIRIQSCDPAFETVRAIIPRQHRRMLIDVDDLCLRLFNRRSRLTGLLNLIFVLLTELRRHPPDIIHAHSTFAGAIVRVLGCFRRLPKIVYCPHGWAFDIDYATRWKRLIVAAEKFLASRCAAIVAISDSEHDSAIRIGIPGTNIRTIYNGVRDVAVRDEVGSQDHGDVQSDGHVLRLLFVGRLDRQKGFDIVIDALRLVKTSVHLRVAGASVVARSHFDEVSLPNVDFLGWLDQQALVEEMLLCDILIVASRWEGFGLVAIEAMRAGKPVIASAVGGLREVVVDGKTGLLFPVGDARALAGCIESIRHSSLKDLGHRGRSRFLERYLIDRTHLELKQLYLSLLASDGQLESDLPREIPISLSDPAAVVSEPSSPAG